ncbi:MAG: potassium channel family protein [Marinibacterium sp.]|nr:potassium channel family protein [Marinibacterium sp.]
MGPNEQILWGSGLLGLCMVVHVMVLSSSQKALAACETATRNWDRAFLRDILVMHVALVILILSHTLQIWLWAIFLVHDGALEGWNEAIYFSLITYTTLGYGDVVLGPEHRIFGSFAAVTGLFAVGISTAYLVAVTSQIFRRMMPDFNDPGSEQR